MLLSLPSLSSWQISLSQAAAIQFEKLLKRLLHAREGAEAKKTYKYNIKYTLCIAPLPAISISEDFDQITHYLYWKTRLKK